MPIIALNNSQKPLQSGRKQSTLVAEQFNSISKVSAKNTDRYIWPKKIPKLFFPPNWIRIFEIFHQILKRG